MWIPVWNTQRVNHFENWEEDRAEILKNLDDSPRSTQEQKMFEFTRKFHRRHYTYPREKNTDFEISVALRWKLRHHLKLHSKLIQTLILDKIYFQSTSRFVKPISTSFNVCVCFGQAQLDSEENHSEERCTLQYASKDSRVIQLESGWIYFRFKSIPHVFLQTDVHRTANDHPQLRKFHWQVNPLILFTPFSTGLLSLGSRAHCLRISKRMECVYRKKKKKGIV